VRYLFDVIACSVWLVDSQTKELVCRQASGLHSERNRGWRLAPGKGFAGWVVQHGEALIIPDTRADQRHIGQVDQEIGIEYRSVLGIPLWSKEEVIGALYLLDTQVNRFNALDVTLLESLAATAAIAIENARLYEQARQDAQTKSRLLHEVNHRVKNNLAAIIGLLFAEQHHASEKNKRYYQAGMQKLISRIQGLATVHHMLSTSEWGPLSLRELATQVVNSSLQILPLDKRVDVVVTGDNVQVTPEQASSLALVLNELATNTTKYALLDRQAVRITIRIGDEGGNVLLLFRDNGPGYPEAVTRMEQRNVGLYLIAAIIRNDLRGELTLYNDNGAITTIRFKTLAGA
jgi:two-component sensor histidine kinase